MWCGVGVGDCRAVGVGLGEAEASGGVECPARLVPALAVARGLERGAPSLEVVLHAERIRGAVNRGHVAARVVRSRDHAADLRARNNS